MEFLHAAIALLASMVLVLAGMVGWLYWQQQRMIQGQTNITLVLGELARAIVPPPEPEPEPEVAPEPVAETVAEPVLDAPAPTEAVAEPEVETDDRVSVEQGPEIVDTDGLEGKTKKELQEILAKRGIPFGKNDAKGVLISLLKATS